jgi:hypothetical protein
MRYWVAVASADHVRRGKAGGFMQLGHGKEAPLRRLRPGDRIAYYSPTGSVGGKDRLQAFTAIGIVGSGGPYRGDGGLYRRNVHRRLRSRRSSIGWNSLPAGRTGAIGCASASFRSARTTSR